MKNKIISEYEKKVWYRVTKSLYIILFVIFIAVYNLIVFIDGYFNGIWNYLIIGNLIIIFVMGTAEGLFWYIVNGKWGYPKNDLLENDKK